MTRRIDQKNKARQSLRRGHELVQLYLVKYERKIKRQMTVRGDMGIGQIEGY